MSIIELDLYFMIIYLCMKYESNTPMFSKDIARKPFFVRTGRTGRTEVRTYGSTDVRTRVMLYAPPPPIINGGGIKNVHCNIVKHTTKPRLIGAIESIDTIDDYRPKIVRIIVFYHHPCLIEQATLCNKNTVSSEF